MADVNRDVLVPNKTESQTERQINRLERKPKYVFDTCCYRVPLLTGCLIFAYLYLLGTIIILIITSKNLADLVDLTSMFPLHGLGPLIAAHVILLILLLVAIPFSVLLIIGLHKYLSKNVKIFIIFKIVALVLHVILQIWMMADGLSLPFGIFLTIGGIAFDVYFLLVLRSQYLKMGESINGQPPHLLNAARNQVEP